MTEPRVVPLEDGRCGVLVPPELVRPVFALMAREAGRAQRVDGYSLGGPARQLLQALRDADVANSTASTSVNGTKSGVSEVTGPFWLTCKEASDILGRTPRWVISLAHRGALEGAVRHSRVWLIPAPAVRAYMALHP